MKLPITVLIGIVLAVIVLISIVALFLMTGGGAASRTELQQRFTEGCLIVCSMEQRTSASAVRLTWGSGYDGWQNACEQLYSVPHGAHIPCLEQCRCGTLPTLCERLQRAVNDVGANCQLLCDAALTDNATRLLYAGCECNCA